MDENLYPHWPELDADTLQSIGRFIVAWGVLETQIDAAIADLYNFDEITANSVTANHGTKARLELFMAGVATFSDILPDSIAIGDMNKLANDTATISNKFRNLVAHGRPVPIIEENLFPKPYWLWGRLSARKGGVKMTASELQQNTFEYALRSGHRKT
tara:strand:- start:938 stop:1411 length:474 start_codon:yes stop_codon:yes gene_type:complete